MKKTFINICLVLAFLALATLAGMTMARVNIFVKEQQVVSYTYNTSEDVYDVRYGYNDIKIKPKDVKVKYYPVAKTTIYVKEYKVKSFLFQNITDGETRYELIIMMSTN